MSEIVTNKYPLSDCVLNVAETGTGQPILLIHGWTNDWRGWTLLAQELSKNYKLYMIDLPGFGQSTQILDHSLPHINKIIHEFILKQNIKPVAIIGGSLGTIVAANLLETYPHISKNLIEIGAVFFKNMSHKTPSSFYIQILSRTKSHNLPQQLIRKIIANKYTAYFIEKYLNSYKFDQEKVDKYSLPGRKLITARGYIELGITAHEYNLTNFLQHTDKNTLLIYGAAEKYTNPKLIKEFVENLNKPNLEIKIIPKCGHNPAYEKPQETASLIRQFLQNKPAA